MNRAFTLIELLVVIAIIAILAAILFPVFASAKVAAKMTQALNNVKQINTAVAMYLSDNDDTYPLLYTPGSSAANYVFNKRTYSWQNVVQPYAKNWNIFLSPFSKFQNSDPTNSYDVFFSYGMLGNSSMAKMSSYGDTYYSKGVKVRLNGVSGLFIDNGFWPSTATAKGGNSLTSSQIARPAEQLVVSDAYAPDMFMGTAVTSDPGNRNLEDIFNNCFVYVDTMSTIGLATSGPAPRVHQKKYSPCNNLIQYGGQVASGFADGHVAHKQLMDLFKVSTISDGTKVYWNMYPAE